MFYLLKYKDKNNVISANFQKFSNFHYNFNPYKNKINYKNKSQFNLSNEIKCIN